MNNPHSRRFALATFAATLLAAALAYAAAAPAAVPAAPPAGTYTIDKSHSAVGFKIRHIVSQLPGKFKDFAGTIVIADDPTKNTIEATIQATSIDTESEGRDNHLRNPDYFDVAKFPTLTFKSTAWKKTGADEFDVTGDLAMHGVTKPVTLKVKSLGSAPAPRGGGTVAGWTATGTLNRIDWGVGGSNALLGDEVAIDINIEAAKPQ